MVFILVDLSNRELVVNNTSWRNVVAEIKAANLLPAIVTERINHQLSEPIGPDETNQIALHLAQKQVRARLALALGQDQLDQIIAFLEQSNGCEVI